MRYQESFYKGKICETLGGAFAANCLLHVGSKYGDSPAVTRAQSCGLRVDSDLFAGHTILPRDFSACI